MHITPCPLQVNATMSLKSRSAVLGELHNFNFVAVCCGRGDLAHYTYALTRTGQLCLFGKNRTLEKFTDTKVRWSCVSVRVAHAASVLHCSHPYSQLLHVCCEDGCVCFLLELYCCLSLIVTRSLTPSPHTHTHQAPPAYSLAHPPHTHTPTHQAPPAYSLAHPPLTHTRPLQPTV